MLSMDPLDVTPPPPPQAAIKSTLAAATRAAIVLAVMGFPPLADPAGAGPSPCGCTEIPCLFARRGKRPRAGFRLLSSAGSPTKRVAEPVAHRLGTGALAHRTPPRPVSSRVNTFGAGRCSRNFFASSRMRTRAQTRAEIESPRVRVPSTARCELPATTPPRSAAHTQYRGRYRSAFGHRPPRTGARLSYLVDEDPGTVHRLTLRA